MNQESDCEWQVLQGKEAKDLHTFHFPSHKHNVENGYLWFVFTFSNLMSWSSLLFSLEIKIMSIYVYITSLQKTSAKILVFYTWQPFRKTRFFLFLHWAVFISCWMLSLHINIITLIYFLSKCQAHKMPAYSVCSLHSFCLTKSLQLMIKLSVTVVLHVGIFERLLCNKKCALVIKFCLCLYLHTPVVIHTDWDLQSHVQLTGMPESSVLLLVILVLLMY